ncbi:MAG: IMPACT family protein [Defluviitaleaceae bacterium]|nr:IMPACT family protein [Defluviitaleaceae bacterium]
MNKYKTIFKHEIAETIEKKSKFIGNAKPVRSREEAELFIAEVRQIHKEATHNVFAYRVYETQKEDKLNKNEFNTPLSSQNKGILIERQTDDGEPSGTAGLPILNYLKGEDLLNICIVVTRYYGGTLLGTGGLVRAYGTCAKQSTIAAGIITKELYSLVNIKIDYSLLGKVEYEILNLGYTIVNTDYNENVSIYVALIYEEVHRLEKKIIEVTSNNALIAIYKDFFGFWHEEKLCGIPLIGK